MLRASKPSERPMFNRLFSFVTAAVVFGLAWNSFSQASEQALPKATWTPVGEETSIPYGWVDFCNRHADECALGKLKPVDVRMTRQVWKTLNEVNAFANSTIEPISNLDHWGTTLDHWDYPIDGKGDCKIYALFKRKLLIERGFPRQALLMTIAAISCSTISRETSAPGATPATSSSSARRRTIRTCG
jgi:predicted transglutaminase-like cysteine proteinase